MEQVELTKSIIHNCPAIRLPQTFLQKIGNMAQIIVLHGATEDQAKEIVDRLNRRADVNGQLLEALRNLLMATMLCDLKDQCLAQRNAAIAAIAAAEGKK